MAGRNPTPDQCDQARKQAFQLMAEAYEHAGATDDFIAALHFKIMKAGDYQVTPTKKGTLRKKINPKLIGYAMDASRERSKTLGTYSPDKQELSGPGGKPLIPLKVMVEFVKPEIKNH